jgi:hypothetical protein
MLKYRSSLLAVLAAMFVGVLATPAKAHEGHHKAITKEVAVQRGKYQIEKLVTAGKLESSWNSKATLQSVELREKGEAKEWALVYLNADASKPDARALHLVLSESGGYVAADLKGS